MESKQPVKNYFNWLQVQEHEKKKAYAAELQAQMQEQQMQRQQERVQRFGPRSGVHGVLLDLS